MTRGIAHIWTLALRRRFPHLRQPQTPSEPLTPAEVPDLEQGWERRERRGDEQPPAGRTRSRAGGPEQWEAKR